MTIQAQVTDVDTKANGDQAITLSLQVITTVNGATVTIPLPYGNHVIQAPKGSPHNGAFTPGSIIS